MKLTIPTFRNRYLLILFGILLNFQTLYSQDCNCIGNPIGYVIDNKKRSEIPTSVFNSNSTFYINGTFSVDGYLNLTNKTLIMGPKARIVLETSKVGNVNLQIVNCTIKGCGCMWEGITVNKRTVLTFTNNNIQDAYHAIFINGGSIISDKAQLQNIVGNTFENNYIGIWIEKFFTITNIPWQNTQPFLVGNTFTSTRNLSSGYFEDGFNGCIGIYGNNVREVVQIGKSPQALKRYPPNVFSNLTQGIYLTKCDSASIVIENNQFNDISDAAISIFDNAEILSQIFNNTFNNTIIGITVETAPALVRNNSFKGGNYGIYLFNSNFEVFNNKLDSIAEGIKVGGTSKIYGNVLSEVGLGIEVSANSKDYVAVFENSIKCLKNGVTLFSPSPASNIDIYKNNITLDNQGKNIDENGNIIVTSGILVDDFLDKNSDPTYSFASIHDNTISIVNGNYGMYLNYSKELTFQNNIINTRLASGITMSNSDSNTFILNKIRMSNVTEDEMVGVEGITIYKSIGNKFLCNEIDNFGTAISFTGNCKNSDLKNNKIGLSIFGITYNKNAVSGHQIENGNQFIGPFSEYALSHAGNDSIVSLSLFKIGGQAIAPYWPETVFQDSAIGTKWIESTNGINWDDCKSFGTDGRSASISSSDDNMIIVSNPNQGDFILNLSNPTLEPCQLIIYDAMGIIQRTQLVGTDQVNIIVNASELESGWYTVKLIGETFMMMTNMVVIH